MDKKYTPSQPAGLADAMQLHAARPKLRGRPRKDHVTVIDADILKIATALFGELGYAATTMEAVAANAGVAKRTLYLRYPDKAALFKDVIETIIRQAMNPLPTEFIDMRSCLSFHIENYFIICSDPSMRVIAGMADAAVQSQPELAALAQEFTHEFGTLRIGKSIADTARKIDLSIRDPEFFATALLDLAGGHADRVRLWQLRSDFASYKFAAQRVVNLLLAGISADNQAGIKK